MVTVGTGAPRPNPAAEALAIGTALLAEQAGLTDRALVDGLGPGGAGRQGWQLGRVAPPPGGLAARC